MAQCTQKVHTINNEKITEENDKKERIEYLVDWEEYPNQPTWESPEVLKKCYFIIEKYNQSKANFKTQSEGTQLT
jgi:hypothetical protein